MKRQLINSKKPAALIIMQLLLFFFLLIFTSQNSLAQTQDTKLTDENPVSLSSPIAELGSDGWLSIKNYQRGDKIETFSIDVSDALLSISKDSVSSSSFEVQSMLGIKEAIVIFFKNGGVVAVRRNGRGSNSSGFKTDGLIASFSLEKTSSPDIWSIVVNGKSEYSVRVSGRPMDQVLLKTPRT